MKQSLLLPRQEQNHLNSMENFSLTWTGNLGRIMKAQVMQAPWEDVFRITHTKSPAKNWLSFHECVRFHLQTVFHFDAGEVLKHYIMHTLKKPNWVLICQFFVRVEQLNSYLEALITENAKVHLDMSNTIYFTLSIVIT